MPEIVVNYDPQVPIYKQIADQIKQYIVDKGYKPGYRMPSVRGLSQKLSVNPATVAHAYHQLGKEGVLTANRRHGTMVAGETGNQPRMPLRQSRLYGLVNNLILDTLSRGYTPDEIETMLGSQLSHWRSRRESPTPPVSSNS
jgi:GntR family transcriptional regulator